MKKNFLVLITLIALIVIAFYFNKDDSSKEKDNLSVGVIAPLTGPVSAAGEDLVDWMMLANDKLNSSVVLYVEDSKSVGAEGVTAAEKLFNTHKIDILVSMQSAVVIPVVSIADRYNTPFIATAISKNEFTNMSQYTFRLFTPASLDAGMMANLANKLNMQNMAAIYIQDEYGTSMEEHFEKNFKGKITKKEAFSVSELDFKTILMKIDEKSVDGVFFVGYNPHYIQLFKQIKELNKNITIITNNNAGGNFVRNMTGNLLNNAYAVLPVSTIDKNNTFAEEYRKKYNKEPDWTAPFGYDIMLFLDYLQREKGNLTNSLYKIEIDGWNGKIHFDKNREISINMTTIYFDYGKIIPIGEIK